MEEQLVFDFNDPFLPWEYHERMGWCRRHRYLRTRPGSSRYHDAIDVIARVSGNSYSWIYQDADDPADAIMRSHNSIDEAKAYVDQQLRSIKNNLHYYVKK
jgi:hypothetical protein